MSLLSTIQSARSGLMAASTGIQTTAHNVANVSTDGFHRRSVETEPHNSLMRKGLTLGQGVGVTRIRRATDDLLGVRLTAQTGAASEAATTYAGLQRVETWFNEAEMPGMNQRLEEFFDTLSQATSDPADDGLRRNVSQAGENLATTVRQTADGMVDALDDYETDLEMHISQINVLSAQLAAVNTSIYEAGDALGSGDMLDKRDSLVGELAQYAGVTVDYQANGGATVFVGGHALVSDGEYRELTLTTDSAGDHAIYLETGNGDLDVTSLVGGGLGGLLKANELVEGYLDDINTFAEDFANALNTQHALGFDASGTAGGTLYSFTAGQAGTTIQFSSTILADADGLAFAGAATALAGDDDNLQALLDLQSTDIINGSSQTGDAFLSSLLGSVATDVATYSTRATQEQALYTDLSDTMVSLTGVSLDQEAANLVEFQAAYQAAAKVIQAADNMLATMLEML